MIKCSATCAVVFFLGIVGMQNFVWEQFTVAIWIPGSTYWLNSHPENIHGFPLAYIHPLCLSSESRNGWCATLEKFTHSLSHQRSRELHWFINLFIYLLKKNPSNRPCNFPCEFRIKRLEGFKGVKNTGTWCNQQVTQGLIFHSETRFLQINKSCILECCSFFYSLNLSSINVFFFLLKGMCKRLT